jgi:cytochrome c peroxidase
LAAVALLGVAGAALANMLTPLEKLGGMLYRDENLSWYRNQSCMTCHHPMAAFVDPDNTSDPFESVVSTGSDGVSLGGREAPTAAYAAFSPAFYWDDSVPGEELYIGGQFWDGRADTLVEQAKGPFLNPVEMAMPSKAAVVERVKEGHYAKVFVEVFGRNAFRNVDKAYDNIAKAIAAFESTQVFNRFSSKYDAYLAGKAKLTQQEKWGLELFEREDKGNCAACHPSRPAEDGIGPLFTDFSYDNLGMPKSDNPQIAGNPIDYGLGARQDLDPCTGGYAWVDGVRICMGEAGKFKVPTLRNIARTPPYGHNGYFATLEEIVEFYNTAGDGTWPEPEVNMNVNRDELGNLGLSPAEVKAIVAFLNTLSDGYMKDCGPSWKW